MNRGKKSAGADRAFAGAIESFYIETTEGLFFAVKGLEHPPGRRIAVVRYVPDPVSGDRHKGAMAYRRLYHFSEQEETLRAQYPRFLAFDPAFRLRLQSVPLSAVAQVHDPRRKYREMAGGCAAEGIEADACGFLDLLRREAHVPASDLGITGSLLVGLHTRDSDLDLVVFGSGSCAKVHGAMRRILDGSRGGELRRLDADGMAALHEQRDADTRMDYDVFLALEKRKVNQGRFRQRPYFVRFVPKAHEVGPGYGHLRYSPQGRTVIDASVVDDREAIFTPCRYGISGVRILEGPSVGDLNEIVSFRGRFCEQARAGESVRATGTLERVETATGSVHHRLLLGNAPEDSLVPKPC